MSKKDSLLAVVYNVWISGTMLDISKKQCITSIDFKETVEGADVATLHISDVDFLFIEDNIFIEDNKIRIMMGFDDETYRVDFNGYISAIDINFESNGIPTIIMTCLDETHKMNKQRKDKTFENTTNAEVVKSIVGEYGYTCVVEENYAFPVQETITQSQQTDIEFITKLAQSEVHPFTARLVGKTFYYVKMGRLASPKLRLYYRDYPHTLVSFSPRINKEMRKVEIKRGAVGADKATQSAETKKDVNLNKSGSVAPNDSNVNVKKTYSYNPKTMKWEK